MTSSRIQVAHGRSIDPLHPTAEEIFIEDIGHSLSNQCRFTGHVKKFYSVAEHSVRASLLVPAEYALEALIHDGSEAYICDIARPLKQDPDFGGAYKRFEATLQTCINRKFGVPDEMSPEVKKADDILLATEVRDLLIWSDTDDEFEKLWSPWLPLPPTEDRILWPWEPRQAKNSFLSRFAELTLGKENEVVATASA